MEKRATIKDIANKAGVSSGTVHRALNGKPGVGEAVRTRILEVAKEFDYRPNYVASSLKRKALRVVAAFPGSNEQNRYYYSCVWQGYRAYMEEMHDYNLQVIELPYYGEVNGQGAELNAVLARYHNEIDGLITVGHLEDERGKQAIRHFSELGIPVMLVCDDIPESGRMGCVQANYDVTGRLVAELLSSQVPAGSSVLTCAGDVLVTAHRCIVQGFENYLAENNIKLNTIHVYGFLSEQDLAMRLREHLESNPNISAIYSVSARISVTMAKVIKSLGLDGHLRVIGSDLFDENVKNMEAGILNNLIFKNPYKQAYTATKVLMDRLIKGIDPVRDVQYVESVLLFKSNLSMYL